MILFILLIALLCFPGCQIRAKGFHEDYLSAAKMKSIKGIFLLMVFCSHFYTYVSLSPSMLNDAYMWLRRFLGQLIVAPFLFYSGYGIAQSIANKPTYLRRMPTHRILKVLFQFDLAILLFLAYRAWTGTFYSVGRVLLTFAAWDGIGNSNWYIFAILWMYIITWIAYSVFENHQKLSLYSCTALAIVFAYFMSQHRQGYWYNTIMCYIAGLWYAQYQREIEELLFSKERIYWFTFILTGIFFLVFHQNWNGSMFAIQPCYQATAVLFSLLIVLFSMKVRISNRVLDYCGTHLFSLYILQRIPMLALKDALSSHLVVYFVSSLALTIGMAYVFDIISPRLWNAVCKNVGAISKCIRGKMHD